MQPIFDLKSTFDSEVVIADESAPNKARVLPFKIKRLRKGEHEEFLKGWNKYFQPRGIKKDSEGKDTLDLPSGGEDFEKEQVMFGEKWVSAAITMEPGIVRYCDEDVTTGAQILEAFCSRGDIIAKMLGEIFVQNQLFGIVRKNSNSPRGSVGGSELSIPTHGGRELGPTVTSVESLTTAGHAAATENPELEDGKSRDAVKPTEHLRTLH